ncbi:Ribosome biogenesis protein [Wickerhamomyces ciferrii]|uniref:Ribosome biogenesis protein RLP7 n=1 Tax=Wickerhamomyces ciferrii (strain ATCC 14091 / BCRC 22168 / CBS 111 / JCM 3599 / NBRC 0793 / NRRL Y-1031 F-60-10) TaxID=1206466 RepID=K0KQB6_WICCF|nr:Ribosome biogenesis protein [Wickerhamomyces ciferrii]CCH43418.1 Ribosome biogenesis protein [Wickerhamomyces ciferrii]
MVELNSNPEILLRKRKNADRLRIEKQEDARKRQEEAKRKKSLKKNRFIRAETLVAKNLASKREHERVKRVSKIERNSISNSNENKHYIEKINSNGIKSKNLYNGEPTLFFIIRINGPHGVKIPSKIQKILNLLRLTHINTGVFIKLTESIYPLIKLISPYTVIGKPSLQSVRQLIQKRATINVSNDEGEGFKTIKLNDNNIVEEKLGDEGIICIEDLIHEIVTLGENFKIVSYFLNPFELNNDIVGFGPLAKLKKLEKRESQKENKTFSQRGSAPILEVDIDEFISQQN